MPKHVGVGTWYEVCKGKGKGKVQPRTGHEDPEGGGEVELYSFFNLGARLGWVVNVTARPLYPSPLGEDPVPTV